MLPSDMIKMAEPSVKCKQNVLDKCTSRISHVK